MTEGKAPMKPYSVLLLYPDWVNESGTDTYYTFVEAADPCAAIGEAQREALAANEWTDFAPLDFAPLLVTEGRNDSQPFFNS